MKAYELMGVLSKAPAGAEVKVNALTTLAEFTENGATTEIEGVEHYSLHKGIREAEVSLSDDVVLYV